MRNYVCIKSIGTSWKMFVAKEGRVEGENSYFEKGGEDVSLAKPKEKSHLFSFLPGVD